jgi:hypothetical protein
LYANPAARVFFKGCYRFLNRTQKTLDTKKKPFKMKRLVLIIFLIFFSCTIYYERGQWGSRWSYEDIELTYRDGLYYYLDKPFTGIIYSEYAENRKKAEMKYKDGKKDGVWEWYYPTGGIMRKEFWENGVLTNTMEWDQ